MDAVNLKAKKHKKKHKYDIEKEEEVEPFKSEKVFVESSDITSPNEKKAKKKKKKKTKHEESEETVRENITESETNAVSNKRKVTEIENGHDEVKSEKKRKRKDHSDMEVERPNDISEIMNTEDASTSENIFELNDINSKKKKKSKKKKIETEEDIKVEISNENDKDNILEITDTKKKKKHKKKHKGEPEEFEEIVEIKRENDETLCQDLNLKKKKKKDKKNHKNADKDSKETNRSNEKVQSSEKEKGVGMKRLDTSKEVNEFENKAKKSQEITYITKAAEKEDIKAGQWSSVELGDSDRQNKFFRLLGGFKKGNDTSQMQNKFSLGKKPLFGSVSNGHRKTGGSYAMDKKQEEIYTKALEGEYERAMTMNLNRGIGLGFEKPPEEGKKFYIDTKSSKSVKFDD